VGWFSHADPFEFDITHFDFRPGALRFWGGTPSVLPYAVAAAGIGVLSDIGVERIRGVNLAHTARVIEAAQARGIPINTPLGEHERGGTVALRFPDSAAATLALQARGIRCDSRPRSGVRISPHVYNIRVELDQLVAALEEVWQRP
jgi:kynureninase